MSDSDDAQDSRSPRSPSGESSSSLERIRLLLHDHTKKIDTLELCFGRSCEQHQAMEEKLDEMNEILKSIQFFLHKASRPPHH